MCGAIFKKSRFLSNKDIPRLDPTVWSRRITPLIIVKKCGIYLPFPPLFHCFVTLFLPPSPQMIVWRYRTLAENYSWESEQFKISIKSTSQHFPHSLRNHPVIGESHKGTITNKSLICLHCYSSSVYLILHQERRRSCEMNNQFEKSHWGNLPNFKIRNGLLRHVNSS